MPQEIIERLKSISLFKEFKDSDEDLMVVAKIIKIKNVDEGAAIIKEGDMGSEMFILNKGSVHIERTTLENESYRIITLSANMNIFFGEQALMDSDRRSASVIAAEPCELYVIEQKDFITLGNDHPRLGLCITRQIAKKLSDGLRKSNKDVITLFEALVGELGSEGQD